MGLGVRGCVIFFGLFGEFELKGCGYGREGVVVLLIIKIKGFFNWDNI